MKILLLLFWLAFSLMLNAQTNNSPFDYYSPNVALQVGIDGSYDLNSTSLTNDFTSKFLLKKEINNQSRERSFNKLDSLNQFGGDINLGAHFIVSPDSFFGKSNMAWYMGLRSRKHTNGEFSRDFFNLGFFGNSRFEDKTADLSGFEFNLLSYQQIEGGIIFNQGKSGIGLSVLRGNQHQSLTMPIANVYTAPGLEFVDVDLLLNLRRTDPERIGFQYTNGVGVSLDLFTTINFGTLDTLQHRILLEVRDLGLIRWNKNATQYTVDTNYRFHHFSFDDIFILRDSVFDSGFSDSSLVSQASDVKKSYTTVLPAFFHLAEIFTINEDLSVMGGIKYRVLANYNVNYYISGIYQITPVFKISARLDFGGYGGLNSGLAIRALIKEYFTLTLGTDNLEGFLFPAITSGNSAFIAIHRRF
ncbi:MAG: hypothetical protein H0V01_00835 [Bacteroidetes bacterium]|nr:hypothetical protein [Bacteroidota bacterium]HET6243425.1 DUF5723 family protein [Bacteroidia bacterium]